MEFLNNKNSMKKKTINLLACIILLNGIFLLTFSPLKGGHIPSHEGPSCGMCHCEPGQKCFYDDGMCACNNQEKEIQLK